VVIAGMVDLDAPADVTLAGQPPETAQLVGCAKSRLLPSPVTCRYGDGAVGGVRAAMNLDQVQTTLWVAVLATGQMLDSTILTGPVPNEGDCPAYAEVGTGNYAPRGISKADVQAYFLGFVRGPAKEPRAPSPWVGVTLTDVPRKTCPSCETHLEALTSVGAECELGLVMPGGGQYGVESGAPAATPVVVDMNRYQKMYTDPDGKVLWEWDMGNQKDHEAFGYGTATATVTCSRDGQSSQATAQFPVVH
jgi:hypothetical protein